MTRIYHYNESAVNNALLSLIENQVEFEYEDNEEICDVVGTLNDVNYENLLWEILENITQDILELIDESTSSELYRLMSKYK